MDDYNSGTSSLLKVIENLKMEIKKDKEKSNEINLDDEVNLHKRQYLKEVIQNIVFGILESIASLKEPSIVIRNQRAWANCMFNNILEMKNEDSAVLLQIKFSSKKTNKTFAQTAFLLSKIYLLLMTDSSSSRREIYYENSSLFEDQSQLDSTADKISCLLGVPQWEIGLFTSSKGIVAGCLQIISDTFNIDCSVQGGASIPSEFSLGVRMVSSANFVLVVEKDSAFQKLYDEGFLNHHGPCIMITGKGYPDVNTRLLVKCIKEQLELPIFILVDSDPYGIEIMSIYKFGSLKQSHIGNRLAIPSARWLGVHPTDTKDLNICSADLSTRDLQKVNSLLSRPYVKEDKTLEKQLNFLLHSKKKSEIEGLVQISQGYLTDVYIPMKISSRQFI